MCGVPRCHSPQFLTSTAQVHGDLGDLGYPSGVEVSGDPREGRPPQVTGHRDGLIGAHYSLGAGVVTWTPRALGRTHPPAAPQHPVSPLTLPVLPTAPAHSPPLQMTQRILLPHHFTPHLLSHPEPLFTQGKKGTSVWQGPGHGVHGLSDLL